jgi:hypothetical protein
MKPTIETTGPVPAPEEILRRIGEYRQVGLQHHLPAQVVYQPPQDLCPWKDCGYRLAGIRFNLEKQGDHVASARLLKAWWAGPGLIGPCPSCHRAVLFGLTAKEAVNAMPDGAVVLPDDWDTSADLVVLDG